MSKFEAALDAVCATGVLLVPVWLVYKLASFVLS
jgi:hypothetical protein